MKNDLPTMPFFENTTQRVNSSLDAPTIRSPDFFPLSNKHHFKRGGLLHIPAARRWMVEIEHAIKQDAYGYQIPALSRSKGGIIGVGKQQFTSLSSYDYLGLIGHPDINTAVTEAIQLYGTGTSGSRLLTGTNALHLELERTLADFIGTEASLTVTSGYLANMTPIAALFGEDDLIISDQYAHKSLMEAYRLSSAELQFFAHNDMEALETILKNQPASRRKLIVSEGIFSMDGDRCPLPELIRLKKQYEAFLLIDEAHSIGVNGATGRGIQEYYDIPASEVDIWTGSLSKAIPSNGGYVAGDASLMLYLQHAGAPFFFSSSLGPASASAALSALKIIQNEPERIIRLRQNSDFMRTSLTELGFDTGTSDTAIIPVIAGAAARAHGWSRTLYQRGYLASAIVSPAVALGKSKLRLCARADMSQDMLEGIQEVFRCL